MTTVETHITDDALPWYTEDEVKWNAFLQSDTGKRLLPRVMEAAPVLLGQGDTNAILIRTGEFRGFAEAIKILLSLTHSQPLPPPPPQSLPSLTDDSAWDDGEKLTPPAPTTE